jgi:protein PhnA
MLITPPRSTYWRILTAAMWHENSAVKVIAYRYLKQLSQQSWAQEALDMFYLEDHLKDWAEAGLLRAPQTPTRDSNGALLCAGDNVTLIKDLPVKGAGFTAKRGTRVRGISLTDNPEHIEGRVNGQRIVLVAAFLKKTA